MGQVFLELSGYSIMLQVGGDIQICLVDQEPCACCNDKGMQEFVHVSETMFDCGLSLAGWEKVQLHRVWKIYYFLHTYALVICLEHYIWHGKSC